MEADQFRRRLVLTLAISVPVGLGLSVVGVALILNAHHGSALVAANTTASSVSPSPLPTAAASTTELATATTLPTTSAVETTESPLPAPTTHQPQGDVVITEWHDLDGSNTCADVQIFYDNRSDTPIYKITQSFQTLYTPIHNAGEYPAEVGGPVKSLTQTVGIPAYGRKEIDWQVCAPELAALQNPPSTTDPSMEEIGAQPRTTTWTWAS